MTLLIQVVILLPMVVAAVLLLRSWPFPSPLIRRFLPPKNRWPEAQIRGWLRTGKFHPGFLQFFNRDPERDAPAGDALLAPADGLVTSADSRDGIRYIVIALSFWDMHVQRSPLAGRVIGISDAGDVHTDGEGRDFAFLREKFCPVQTRISMETAIGDVAVRLITSVAARRIETWVDVGEHIERGQRLGRILLGSTVVLEVPDSFACEVVLGTHVQAGLTALARRPIANA